MLKGVILVLASTVCYIQGYPAEEKAIVRNVPIVSREQWGARPATGTTRLNTPVDFVIIHHSSVPGACSTNAECQLAMRQMQNAHQIANGWHDIGYNFAVGGDGMAYEGRGWNEVGAHAPSYNSNSIGIVLIGHWVSSTPPQRQLDVTQALIRQGVANGIISPNYTLLGHRQVTPTECPGQALFMVISTWNNFQNLNKVDTNNDDVFKEISELTSL